MKRSDQKESILASLELVPTTLKLKQDSYMNI